MDQGEIIKTRTCKLNITAEGIVRAIADPGVSVHGLEEARENTDAVGRLGGGRPVPLLVDIRGSLPLSHPARQHYSGGEALRTQTALALIVGSPLSRMKGNFFLATSSTAVPVRLFTSEQEAISWLKQYRR
jgi:hypothetical protein